METCKVCRRADVAGSGLVLQHSRPDDDPFEATGLYDRFLPVLVIVNSAQQERLDQPVLGKTTVTGAVARTQVGDAHEA